MTDLDSFVSFHPASGQSHMFVALIKGNEICVGNWSPLHLDRFHFDHTRWALVVPSKRMTANGSYDAWGEIIPFTIIMSHGHRCGTKGNGWGSRGEASVPLLRKCLPRRNSKPRGRERAGSSPLNEHIQQRLIGTSASERLSHRQCY